MTSQRMFGLALAGATLLSSATFATDAPAQAFRLMSPVFEDGAQIPTLYTCEGSNISPPLSWADPPPKARSFAVALDDKDARAPKAQRPLVHWILFNVPAETRTLGEALQRNRLPGAAAEGTNDFDREGYDGPCASSGRHRYVFTVFALDTMLDRVKYRFAPWPEIEQAMSGHVIATTTVSGTHEKIARAWQSDLP